MSAQGVHFKWNLHLLKEVGCFTHYGQVGSAAHDYAYGAHIVIDVVDW